MAYGDVPGRGGDRRSRVCRVGLARDRGASRTAAGVAAYRWAFSLFCNSPTMPCRNTSTKSMKTTPWISSTHGP